MPTHTCEMRQVFDEQKADLCCAHEAVCAKQERKHMHVHTCMCIHELTSLAHFSALFTSILLANDSDWRVRVLTSSGQSGLHIMEAFSA